MNLCYISTPKQLISYKKLEALHDRALLNTGIRHHSANSKSRLKMDEQIVQDIVRCLKEWESNPWDTDKIVLRSLESGLIAPKDLVVDFDTAKVDGSRQIDEYFEERVKTTQNKVIDRIKQNKRHSFRNPPEKAVKKHDKEYRCHGK